MTFLVDTNVMMPGKFRKFLQIAKERGHKVQVPALIYAERVFQLQRENGRNFQIAAIDDWFNNFKGTLELLQLDRSEAAVLARTMAERFPTEEDWQQVKREFIRRSVGAQLADSLADLASKCGASVDLYVVGLASRARPIVTMDKGPEWRGWPEGAVVSYEEAMRLAGAP